MAVRTTPEQHSVGRSVALHLLPGAATVAAFYLLVPVAGRLGFSGFFWGPIQPAFRDELFGFLPDWVRQPFGFEDPGRFSSGALVTTAVLFVALNGIIGPTVEELYFRGHLLPRIDRLGAWAPVLNASLFTLYHLWSPWQLPVRVLQTLPFIYLVWRKRSLYLGLVVHCLMNTIGAVGVVPRMLSGA